MSKFVSGRKLTCPVCGRPDIIINKNGRIRQHKDYVSPWETPEAPPWCKAVGWFVRPDGVVLPLVRAKVAGSVVAVREPTQTVDIEGVIPSVATYAPVEVIKHVDETGEWWDARELMVALGYDKWWNFEPVISSAMEACKTAGQDVEQNFLEVQEVSGKRGPKRRNYRLSKYAMLLVVQKADSSKTVPAEGQTYQAVQTHRSEIIAERGVDPIAAKPVERLSAPADTVSIDAAAKMAAQIFKQLTVEGWGPRPATPVVEAPKVSELPIVVPQAVVSEPAVVKGFRAFDPQKWMSVPDFQAEKGRPDHHFWEEFNPLVEGHPKAELVGNERRYGQRQWPLEILDDAYKLWEDNHNLGRQ